MRKLFMCLMLASLMILSGCAVKYSCYKPGMSQPDFQKDNYECVQQSRTYGGGSGFIGLAMIAAAQNQADRMYKMCMESRGYTLTPEYQK